MRGAQALEELGLRPSSKLGQAVTAALPSPDRTAGPEATTTPVTGDRGEERRLVTVVFVELSAGAGTGRELDPEAMREVVGGALATIVDEVEDLGGKVTSISSNGVLAIFGAPDANEDDRERALRAAFRVLNGSCEKERNEWARTWVDVQLMRGFNYFYYDTSTTTPPPTRVERLFGLG